jgi:hypothetical protein
MVPSKFACRSIRQLIGLWMPRSGVSHRTAKRMYASPRRRSSASKILSAFDAFAEWMTAQGLSASGAPREVYFTDFMAAAPSHEACGGAFPMDGAAP